MSGPGDLIRPIVVPIRWIDEDEARLIYPVGGQAFPPAAGDIIVTSLCMTNYSGGGVHWPTGWVLLGEQSGWLHACRTADGTEPAPIVLRGLRHLRAKLLGAAVTVIKPPPVAWTA